MAGYKHWFFSKKLFFELIWKTNELIPDSFIKTMTFFNIFYRLLQNRIQYMTIVQWTTKVLEYFSLIFACYQPTPRDITGSVSYAYKFVWYLIIADPLDWKVLVMCYQHICWRVLEIFLLYLCRSHDRKR